MCASTHYLSCRQAFPTWKKCESGARRKSTHCTLTPTSRSRLNGERTSGIRQVGLPCKVTPVILHGVVFPDLDTTPCRMNGVTLHAGLYAQRSLCPHYLSLRLVQPITCNYMSGLNAPSSWCASLLCCRIRFDSDGRTHILLILCHFITCLFDRLWGTP